ncbi:MAG TPA: beta-propeller fold lactonase family protein [Bryobacteraceae bacterium]
MFKTLILLFAGCSFAQTRLPQGWTITPEGRQIRLAGDFPAKIVETSDAKHILVATGGYHDRGLYLVDVKAGSVVADTSLTNAYGDFAFDSGTGRIFVAGGDSATGILRTGLRHIRFLNTAGIEIAQLGKRDRYVTGVVLAPDGALFAVNINTDTVFRLAPGDYHVEASAKAGYGAYRAALSPDGKTLAVSNWGDQSIDLFSADRLQHVARVPVGIHPNDLLFAKDGRLFVANAGSNSVSIVRGRRVEETIKTSIDPGDPAGSTPDALAIDPRGKTLFVANADNNDVAVIDIADAGHSELEGFIPTGWYPSALAVSGDGKHLYVGVAKGLGSRANVPAVAHPIEANSPVAYDSVGHTLTGYLSVVPVPNEAKLRELTRKVIANRPHGEPDIKAKADAARIRETVFSKIRHVLYIIRENRTYDQVLGDLGEGNSDPSLTMFGEDVTPNAHKLARQFTLLDNLFVNGEVSENGHQWSDAAYATQFTSQAWLSSYSGHTEPKKNESELGADERLRSSPAGYLWDNCARHGVSFRTYGEFAYYHPGPDSEPRFVAMGLQGHASVDWLRLASAGWTDITKGRDPDLAKVFIREMRTAEKAGEWPRFMVMSLGEDHTHALRPGHYTPRAMVASNDQALGEIVEAVSHSRFWPETAIFVIEDDAQDGPDHVDCRRTVGFVISPYTRRRAIDHSFYTTAAMIHTMELILGLPSMTQFDRAAEPMYASFLTSADLTPFVRVEPKVDLFAKNPAHGPDAEASLKLDFSEYDRADPSEMNRILWRALKPGIDEPAPVRSMLGSAGR